MHTDERPFSLSLSQAKAKSMLSCTVRVGKITYLRRVRCAVSLFATEAIAVYNMFHMANNSANQQSNGPGDKWARVRMRLQCPCATRNWRSA
jgi:Zn finger protein HypA/HybF involved in hydrogenase expression